MTKVIYGDYGGRFYFEASGHAVSEELISDHGCDEEESAAVCAAISILVLAAAEKLGDMQSSGEIYNSSISVENGYACFDVTPREESEGKLFDIFDLLMTGFYLLEENYPDLICCE